MEVTPRDESNERFVLKLTKKHIPALRLVKLVQARGVSLFDFWGFRNEIKTVGIDVKVRDIPSNKFKDYFISKDKIYMVRAKPEMDFYVIYYFKGDHVLKVFNLREVDLGECDLEFTHKRTGKLLRQNLYTIPSYQHCFRALLI